MKSGFVLNFLLCLFLNTISGQGNFELKYSKVRINLLGKDISELAKGGIETDHGIFVKNRYFVSDFSDKELEIIHNLGFQTEILIDDVVNYYQDPNRKSELMDTQAQKTECGPGVSEGYNYKTPLNYIPGTMGGYFTYQEMHDILDSMAVKYPTLITTKTNINSQLTHQGNHIFYIKVSDNPYTNETTEPEVLYTALHHAREPNSLSQMIFYLWYLLENYGVDPLVTKLVNETEMYFVPCVNPDGYIQNQISQPGGGGLWRKNMWKDSLGNVKGVDLNRNYGHYWGFDNIGSSNNPNSATFRGKAPFSEPETQALRTLCLDHEFKMVLNYHTFGNYLIHPWGYNDLPTSENVLFKVMGNVLNRENSFLMGTGTETVGYTVNGDSDDWMYGEAAEKQAIYAYTPEVGPSFWPPQVDIDYLNKSCVWMNMSTALLTLNYYETEEILSDKYLNPELKNIYLNVTRAGLKNGKCNIFLKSETEGVEVINPAREIELNRGESDELVFSLMIDESFDYPEGIHFSFETDNNGIITYGRIDKEWLNKKFNTIYFDDIKSDQTFISDGWQVTSDHFYSDPSSITDSPGGDYEPDEYKEITLRSPLDLSSAKHAYLNFFAKWHTEDRYDYVQVLASKDNIDFIPLCGKYTKPGSVYQQFNSPLYDGLQATWVKEELDLDDFIGNPKVWIRFTLTSDGYQERDGFYFDDLEVRVVENTVKTEDTPAGQISIFPTIISKKEMCHLGGFTPSASSHIKIRNQTGELVTTVILDNSSFLFDPAFLVNGVYFIEIFDQNKRISVNRIVVLK